MGPLALEACAITVPGGITASFSLRDRECLPICGPSGTGKSRLLRALADLDPHGGSCRVYGREQHAVSGPAWRRMVSLVSAEAGWWADKVGEHFPPNYSLEQQAIHLGLPSDCGQWRVNRLSTGERQRLALLRALAHAPQILLLDEPTSGLDEANRTRVETLLKEWLLISPHACLIVTHDAAQADRLNPRRRLLCAPGGYLEEVST